MRLLLSVLLVSLLLGVPLPATAVVEPVGVWPLEPEPVVVRGFEPPPSPYASGHRGVDLAGAPGQVVQAALPGTIGFAGSIGGKPVVTVLHGGRRTTYEPVVAAVERGQPVAAGEVLGRLLVADSHCFPAACLHWGLIEGTGDREAYVDPLSLVGDGPVRLLPLWRDEPVTVRLPWIPLPERWRRPLDWLARPAAREGVTGQSCRQRRRSGPDCPVTITGQARAGRPYVAGQDRYARGCACW